MIPGGSPKTMVPSMSKLTTSRPGSTPRASGSTASVSFDAAQRLTGPPHLDEQAVAGVGQAGQHDLVELGTEQLAGRVALEVPDEDGPAGDLGFAGPLGGVLGRVDRWAVQREPVIASEIGALPSVGHRAERELAVGELHLDPGDPRRPVGP